MNLFNKWNIKPIADEKIIPAKKNTCLLESASVLGSLFKIHMPDIIYVIAVPMKIEITNISG